MTESTTQQLAIASCVLLFVWELLHKRLVSAALSALMLGLVMIGMNLLTCLVAVVLVSPTVFEERWKPRQAKDLIRSVLAAAIIAANVALMTVYGDGLPQEIVQVQRWIQEFRIE